MISRILLCQDVDRSNINRDVSICNHASSRCRKISIFGGRTEGVCFLTIPKTGAPVGCQKRAVDGYSYVRWARKACRRSPRRSHGWGPRCRRGRRWRSLLAMRAMRFFALKRWLKILKSHGHCLFDPSLKVANNTEREMWDELVAFALTNAAAQFRRAARSTASRNHPCRNGNPGSWKPVPKVIDSHVKL